MFQVIKEDVDQCQCVTVATFPVSTNFQDPLLHNMKQVEEVVNEEKVLDSVTSRIGEECKVTSNC